MTGASPADGDRPEAREARDVMAFGQEVGRVLSDGRIVGRAEPFAKVFASSRAVKRAVGLAAWTILEDIALDARLDDTGRLVAETNVRRIAANLGVGKNAVSRHLARLRQCGFVLHEELRDEGSGRYEFSRYVLDPSACIERFTATPPVAHARTDRPGPPAAPGSSPAALQPCPRNRDTAGSTPPRPRNGDTVPCPVSRFTGHRGGGQNSKRTAAVGEQPQARARGDAPDLIGRLAAVGVSGEVAASLVVAHPPQQIADAVEAVVGQATRNPAGWVIRAVRERWDLSERLAVQRAAAARRQRETQQAAADAEARCAEQRRRRRADSWCAAISSALDDAQLAEAVAKFTAPVAGLGRRSVPLARAQLLAWAVTVVGAAGLHPLPQALGDALASGAAGRPVELSAREDLPDPPPHPPPAIDLNARLGVLLSAEDAPATVTASPSDTCSWKEHP